MRDLVRSEFRKLLTTRMVWGLTAGGAALVALYVCVLAFTAGADASRSGGSSLPGLDNPAMVRMVYGVPFEIGYLMPLILGVIMISGEFRHRTITPTFLACPKRSRVLLAKVVVAGVAGIAMGVVLTALSAGLGAALIAARGYPTLIGSAGIPRLLVMMVIGMGIWCIFGVGFGALLKNQIAAVVTAIVLVTIAESLLTLLLRWIHVGSVAEYLPSNAASAVIEPADIGGSVLLPWWGGGLVLLAWGLVTALLGAGMTLRRDIS